MGVMVVGVLEVPKAAYHSFFLFNFCFENKTILISRTATYTRRRRWENMLVQSNTPSASVWRFPRKNDLDPRNLGWKKCQFDEPALNKAGSFDKLWGSEMALDCECLEGRFWPSIARFEHIRDVKKKPGACIYSRVGIMCSSVPNEMPDLMNFAHAARLPRHHSLLLNRHRSVSEAMAG